MHIFHKELKQTLNNCISNAVFLCSLCLENFIYNLSHFHITLMILSGIDN